MKKLYSAFLLLTLLFTSAYAQNDCSTPHAFLSGSTYTYSPILSTPNPDSTNDYGCLLTQSNVRWLFLHVCNPGNIDLTITASGSTALDVDFIAYGPLASPLTCGLDSSQIEDCSYSTGSTETVNISGALAGEYYKIMISNFSNQPGMVTISQTSGLGSACDSMLFNCSGVPVYSQSICKVSTDPSVNHNFIYWDKDSAFFGNYNIQVETTTAGVYTTLASIASTDTSVYEDMVSDPMVQSFKYRIETADTCGHVMYSSPHTTIHLLTSVSMFGAPQLSWNGYVGFGYSTYFIYRGSSASTLSLYDSISSSFLTYTDVSPAAGMIYYAVSVFPPVPCQPSRSFDDSFSNVSMVLITGITEESTLNDILLGPNPASDEIYFTAASTYEFMSIELYDISGRKLIETATQKNTKEMKVDVSSIGSGYYMARISTEKGSIQRMIIVSK